MKEKENEDVKVEEKQITKEKKKNNVIVYAIVFLMLIGLGIGIGYSLNHFNVFKKEDKESSRKLDDKKDKKEDSNKEVEDVDKEKLDPEGKPIEEPPISDGEKEETPIISGTNEETFKVDTSYPKAKEVESGKLPFKVGPNDVHLSPDDLTDISDYKLVKVHKFDVKFNDTDHKLYVFYYQGNNSIVKYIGMDDTFIESNIVTSKFKGKVDEFIKEDYEFIKNNYHVMKDTETGEEYLAIQYRFVSKTFDEYTSYTQGIIINNNIEKMYELNISDSSYQVRVFAWYGKGIFEHSRYLAKISYEAYEQYKNDDKTITESREVPCFYSRKVEGVIEYYFVEFKDNYFYMLQPRYDEEGNILDYRDYKVEFKNGVLVPEQIAEYPVTNDYPVETKEHQHIQVIEGAATPY